ncbi:MAG: hypothetical protein NUV67_03435 [archaeon]|nr:hypothetical protein [archaeon]
MHRLSSAGRRVTPHDVITSFNARGMADALGAMRRPNGRLDK